MSGGPPFDESLMPAEQPEEMRLIELDERHWEYARRRWPKASTEMQAYRMRQSIWVRFEHQKPHPEDPNRRRLGGPQPNSGRRVNKRLGEALLEEAQRRQKEVIDAAFAPLSEDNDDWVRHKAAMRLAEHEREERKMEIIEDDYARRTDDDIRKEAAAVFLEMLASGEISLEDLSAGTVDGDAEEVEQAQIAS
jgi:hypothetical protein